MLIDWLAAWLGPSLAIFALLFIGIVVEKHYVSRVTVFTNVLALNLHILTLEEIPFVIILFGDIGLILGAYGMLAYLLNTTTIKLYRYSAFFAYSSFPVAAVILASPNDFIWVLVFAGVLNFIVAWVLVEGFDWSLFHDGPHHGEVTRFIESESLEITDPRIGRLIVDLKEAYDT